MATKRLYRSKKGELLGVCKGIAEWRDFPADGVRLIFILIAISTAVFPCLLIYLVMGFILPVNPYEEDTRSSRRHQKTYYNVKTDDFVHEEPRSSASFGDYENRKKENDWDNRFSNS